MQDAREALKKFWSRGNNLSGAAAQGDVEGDDALSAVVHVYGLVELGTVAILLKEFCVYRAQTCNSVQWLNLTLSRQASKLLILISLIRPMGAIA